MPQFKYLGIIFHSSQPLGESVAAGRAAVARFAAAQVDARCEELGPAGGSPPVLMMFDNMVDSMLSYARSRTSTSLAYNSCTFVVSLLGGALPLLPLRTPAAPSSWSLTALVRRASEPPQGRATLPPADWITW